jgi:transcriptional regulator with XRE-family HTH domain
LYEECVRFARTLEPKPAEEAVKQPGDPSPWADNVGRLAGLHGLSHDQLAKLLGMSPQTISTWRSGKRRPSGDAFLAVGEFFEIDPVQLNQRSFEDPALVG